MPHSLIVEQTLARLKSQPVRHLIDGQLADSERHFGVINPATASEFAQCPMASKEQLDLAVAAARRAQPAWAAFSYMQRRDYLLGLAETLRSNQEDLALLITLEQGKPLIKALQEVERAAAQTERLTSILLEPELLRENAHERVELRYRPLGVVAAITPWNMPIVLSVPKIVHALYTGNTLVLKPSPYTPLATLRLAGLVQDLFPAGVLNVLAGGDDFGQWMSEHKDIDKISFTGSVNTGKRVMQSSARNLKRLTLELGGNDAAIVLDDVDPMEIAPKLFAAAFVNSGQVCMAIKRLYVQDGVYQRMVDALAELARNARVGDGLMPGVEIGPVQNLAQYNIVKEILDDARHLGARIVTGGCALDRAGYFIEPTIVSDIAEGTRLVDEEPFGPVLPVIRFTDVAEAVRRANDSKLGLGGSVWSRDVQRAAEIATQLEVGTAWVNHHVGADAYVPFGGAKQSGIGREYGKYGLLQYMETTAVFSKPAPN